MIPIQQSLLQKVEVISKEHFLSVIKGIQSFIYWIIGVMDDSKVTLDLCDSFFSILTTV